MYTTLRYPGFKRKAVTLSYDDGVRDDIRLVDILNKHSLKATFNINSEMFGEKVGDWRLTIDEICSLIADSPHEIAVHGARHLSLTDVDDACAIRDIMTDRENLERFFGRIVKGMAYANGAVDGHTVELVRSCGISYARTVTSSANFDLPTETLLFAPTCHHNDPRLMELAKTFVTEGEQAYFWSNRPRLFYLWGHSYEFSNNNNWHVIEEFAEYISGRDEIWYVTNGQLIDYIKAYKALEYSADGRIIRNPTCTDVYLSHLGTDIALSAGETVFVG